MATFTEDVVSGGRGGFGFGGGGDGMGVLLGLLLARGGIFDGNNNGNNCVNNETINQQTLGDIKAAIPLAEAQVQLAMAGLQSNLSAQATSDTQYLSQGQNAIQLAQQASTAALARDIASVDTNVDRQSQNVQNAIVASERRITDLITSNQIAELNQRLTVAQQEVLELRNESQRSNDRHGIEIQISNNQQQAQLQAQQQGFLLNQLVAGFGQIARATNSQVVVGSTGVQGTQTANPTNVNA